MIYAHSMQKKQIQHFVFLVFFIVFSIHSLCAENFIILHSEYDQKSYNYKYSITDTQNNIKIGEYYSMILQSSNIYQYDQKIFMFLPFDQKLIEFKLNDISAPAVEYATMPGLHNFTISQNKLFFLSHTDNIILVYALPSIEFLGIINTKYKPLAITSNNNMVFISNSQKDTIDYIEAFDAQTHFASSVHNLTDYNPDEAWMTSLNAFEDCLLSLTDNGKQIIGLAFKPFEINAHHLKKKLFCLKQYENNLYGLSASKKEIYQIEKGMLYEKVRSDKIIEDFCVIDYDIKIIEKTKPSAEQTGSCSIL